MTTTDLFWDYFKPLAEAVPGVTSVRLSDGDRMERLISSSVSKKIYPAVFAFRPIYKVMDTGADQYYAMFEVVFYVFCHSKPGDEASQDAAFAEAETIGLAVLHQFRADHLSGSAVEFQYGTARLEPVTMMTLDSTQGYEVKLTLGLAANGIFA